MKSPEDLVDLTSEDQNNPQHGQAHRDELARIDEQIGALQIRRDVIRSELGLAADGDSASSHKAFMDDGFDVFAGSPTRKAIQALDTDDEEFENRFAAFAANDEKGDHKARRWFDSAA